MRALLFVLVVFLKSCLSFKHISILRMSSDRVVISSPLAPAAIGPYSQAIKANGLIFVSGCLGMFNFALAKLFVSYDYLLATVSRC